MSLSVGRSVQQVLCVLKHLTPMLCYRSCPSFSDRVQSAVRVSVSFTLYLILKNHLANFNQTLHKFLDDGNSFCLNEEQHPFSREDDYKTLKIPYPRFKTLPLRTIGPILTKLSGLTSKGHLIIKKEMGFPSPIQLYDINIALSKFF